MTPETGGEATRGSSHGGPSPPARGRTRRLPEFGEGAGPNEQRDTNRYEDTSTFYSAPPRGLHSFHFPAANTFFIIIKQTENAEFATRAQI